MDTMSDSVHDANVEGYGGECSAVLGEALLADHGFATFLCLYMKLVSSRAIVPRYVALAV